MNFAFKINKSICKFELLKIQDHDTVLTKLMVDNDIFL